MDPNKISMQKIDFFRAKIAKITDNFDGDTQRVRAQLILDLKALAEIAHNRAIDERFKVKERQNWARIVSTISRAINTITKEYDLAKINLQLKELKKLVDMEFGGEETKPI